MSDRAEIEISATTSRLASGLRQARSMFSGFASSAAKGLGGAFGKVGDAMKLGDVGKGALGHFAGDIASRGLDTFIDAAGEVRDFERNLTRFQIASNGSAASTARMRTEIDRISQSTAISRDQILAGAASYVAITGDADGASAAMDSFAHIAQASGSRMEDIATAAAALRDNMKIDPADFDKAFSGLIAQGKAGAVEVKDLAAQLNQVAPQFANFKNMGNGLTGVNELGAALQIARKGFGDANQAATGLRSMMTSLVQHAQMFEAAGVRIFDKDPKTGEKTMRNLSAIWHDINASKLVKDPSLLQHVFGREEARQTYDMFRKFAPLYDQLIDAGKDWGTVQRDFNTMMESDSGRLDKAMNQLKLTIAEAFTPERIAAFTSAVETLAAKLGPVVDAVGKIADVTLGAQYAFGKSIRGLFGGDQNPYATYLQQKQDQLTIASAPELQKTKAGRSRIEEARLRLGNAEGFDQAAQAFMGAEKNDRPTAESKTLAAQMYYSANQGQAMAASRYLEGSGVGSSEKGVDRAQVEEIVRGALAASGKSIANDLQRAIAGALGNLKIDIPGDKIVNAYRNSGMHFTRPK